MRLVLTKPLMYEQAKQILNVFIPNRIGIDDMRINEGKIIQWMNPSLEIDPLLMPIENIQLDSWTRSNH